jgi:hypothetical protein
MELKRKNLCPMLKSECIGLDCAWFVKVEGYDINTGKRVDEWNCTVALIPMLLIENSGQQRSTGAAVESFRNEMVKANEASHRVLLAAATNDVNMLKKQLILGDNNQDDNLLE